MAKREVVSLAKHFPWVLKSEAERLLQHVRVGDLLYNHLTLTLTPTKVVPSLPRRKRMAAHFEKFITNYPSDVKQKKLVNKFFAFDNPHFRKQAFSHIPE